jgi:hypothetical protein
MPAATARRTASSRPAARRRLSLPPALALFCVLAAIYLLTSGGHTYSYDEETMFGLTESIVERGSLVVPTCGNCTVLRSIPMPEGRNYSRYGPVQSLVAIPPYLVGRALAGGDDAARWFATRFAATLLTALVTAWIGALLYALARRLGATHGAALLTALLYGLGTQAWPRAKTFFADPLTTLLILAGVYCWWRLDNPTGATTAARTRELTGWAAGLGLLCGVSVGVKFGAGIILLPFGIAGAASLWRAWRAGGPTPRGLATIAGAAALAVAVPLAAVGWYNWVRFGSLTETGYGGREVGAVQGGDWWAGFSGLMLSPGKSLFVFSPVVILGLLSLWPFARRHLRPALLVGGLIVLHIAFYSRVPQWDAGTSWGPRYLDFIVPLCLLPLPWGLAWLAGRGRALRLTLGTLAGAIVALALAVQLLGVLVNFDTGYNAVTDGRRYWTVGNAPPIVHAGILRDRVAAWWAVRFPAGDAIVPDRGIVVANETEALWPRYLPQEASVRVHAAGGGALDGALVYEDVRETREPPARFTILVDGRVVPTTETPAPDIAPHAYRLAFPIRAAGAGGGDFTVTIRNEAFAQLGPSRTLDLAVTRAGTPLPTLRRPLLLPFPNDTPERWSWFFTPRNAHLVDLWPWYLATIHLPRRVAAILYVGVGGGATLLLLVGAGGLVWRWPSPRRAFARHPSPYQGEGYAE